MEAQVRSSFNLNSTNGLPSDHVYGMITDRLGYLWICTDKGVVRYNGYECRKFTMADGLPTNDVFELLEDQTGRIWLGAVSDEIGYLKNGNYHNVYLKGYSGTMFPRIAIKYKSGILFTSSYVNSMSTPSLCLVKGDTVHFQSLNDSLFDNYKDEYGVAVVWLSQDGRVFSFFKRNMYELTDLDSIANGKMKVKLNHLYWSDAFYQLLRFGDYISLYAGGKIVFFEPAGQSFNIILAGINSFSPDTLDVRKLGISEPVEFINYNKSVNDSVIFIYTKKGVHFVKMCTEPSMIGTYNLSGLTGVDSTGPGAVSYWSNSLWDTCVGTKKNGVFLQFATDGRFEKLARDISEFRYVGSTDSNTTYWWNQSDGLFLEIIDDTIVKELLLPGGYNIHSVFKYNDDSVLLLAADVFCFVKKDNKIVKLGREMFGTNISSALRDTHGDLLLSSISGIYKMTRHSIITGELKYRYVDRFKKLIEDNVRKKTWAFNSSKIVIFGDDDDMALSKNQIRERGVIHVNELCVDGIYGNAFVMGINSIMMYDYESGKSTLLLENVNLEGAQMRLQGDVLVVVSSFGIIYYNIIGKNNVTRPKYYRNTKHQFYKSVLDVALTARSVIFTTDNGTFRVPTSYFEDIVLQEKRNWNFNYNFLMQYGDSIVKLSGHDTFSLSQETRILQFDVINPIGNGDLKYNYRLGGQLEFLALSSNEYQLPSKFTPDNYYTIEIYANDDWWKTDVMRVTVYVKPYWWQTHAAIRLIWVGSILLGLAVIVVSVLLTRRVVLKTAERRQLNMEMELKSIYAQINPHFIFNSLNSALLLVSKNKMDEAYGHISKFSKLLRNYLKSSRNKYITIGEEVENLRNYIELQQTRFRSRFRYEIEVKDQADIMSTEIPSLLIQPFVENAINHGILPLKDNSGFISVSFYLSNSDKTIYCIIEDNGIGRAASKSIKSPEKIGKESYGDLMLKDLVSIFNRYEKLKIDIEYADKGGGVSGTIVAISIKRT